MQLIFEREKEGVVEVERMVGYPFKHKFDEKAELKHLKT